MHNPTKGERALTNRTAQRTEEKKGEEAHAFFCISIRDNFFFSGPLLERHNAQEESACFCLFFGAPDHTQKKLNMIAKEFEFVVGRMN